MNEQLGKNEYLSTKATVAILALIILFGAFLRVYNLGDKSFWIDEAYTIRDARRIFHPGLDENDRMRWEKTRGYLATPVYYSVVYPFVRKEIKGVSELKTRLPSAIFGILGIITMFWGGVAFFKSRQVGLWAAFLLSISEFHIAQSRDTRMYTMLVLVGIISAIILYRALTRLDKRGALLIIAVALINCFALKIHSTARVLIASQGCILVVFAIGQVFGSMNNEKRQVPWRRVLIVFLLWSISLAPIVAPKIGRFFSESQIGRSSVVYGVVPPDFTIDGRPLIEAVIKTGLGVPRMPQALFAALMIAIGIAFLFKSRRYFVAFYMIVWASAPLVIVLYFATGRHFWHERYFYTISPAYMFAAAPGLYVAHKWLRTQLDILRKRNVFRFNPRVLGLCSSACVIALVYYTNFFIVFDTHQENWKRAVEIINEKRDKSLDEALFVFPYYVVPDLIPNIYDPGMPIVQLPVYLLDLKSNEEIEFKKLPERLWLLVGYREDGRRWFTYGRFFEYFARNYEFCYGLYNEAWRHPASRPPHARDVTLWVFSGLKHDGETPGNQNGDQESK